MSPSPPATLHSCLNKVFWIFNFERKFGYPSSKWQFIAKLTPKYKQVHVVVVISAATFDSATLKLFSLQTFVNVLNSSCFQIQEGLSPNHLKKAKLMFFYTRYPSSNMLKMFFSDVKVSPNMLSLQCFIYFTNVARNFDRPTFSTLLWLYLAIFRIICCTLIFLNFTVCKCTCFKRGSLIY